MINLKAFDIALEFRVAQKQYPYNYILVSNSMGNKDGRPKRVCEPPNKHFGKEKRMTACANEKCAETICSNCCSEHIQDRCVGCGMAWKNA
jgi:hypothetical protein